MIPKAIELRISPMGTNRASVGNYAEPRRLGTEGGATMNSTMTRVLGGFIAGCLAVLIFHQGMYVVMQQMGLPLRGAPWAMAADPAAFGMPRLFNQMFWGGLWGIVFAYMIDALPGPNVLRGFIFGCVFPMLLGSWLVVAMIKGQPLLSGAFGKEGFNILALRNGFLLNGVAFGIGLGLLYPWLAGMMGGRSSTRS